MRSSKLRPYPSTLLLRHVSSLSPPNSSHCCKVDDFNKHLNDWRFLISTAINMSKPRDSLAKLTEMGLMPLPIRTTQDTTNQEFEEDGESSPDAGEDKENMLAKLKPRYCSRCKKVKGVHAFEGALKTCTMCLIAKRKVKSDVSKPIHFACTESLIILIFCDSGSFECPRRA